MISYNSNKSAASGPWTYSTIGNQATLNAATAGAALEVIEMTADSGGFPCQQIKFDVNADAMILTTNNPGLTKFVELDLQTDTLGFIVSDSGAGLSVSLTADNVFGFVFADEGGQIFRIAQDGHICTNQIQPPAVKATNVGWIPIYNQAGTLKGYLPLFV